MKKFFYLMSLCLCMLAGTAVMTSCGDDDEDVNDKGGNTPAPAFLEMEFIYPCNGTMTNFMSMEITYEAGNEKGTASGGFWMKDVRVELPCTLKFARTVSVAYPEYFVEHFTHNYTIAYEGSYKLLDADGKTIEGSEKTFGETISSVTDEPGNITAEKINQGKLNSEVIFVFDKDGKLVK